MASRWYRLPGYHPYRACCNLVLVTLGPTVTWLSPLQVGAIGGVLKKGSLTFLDQRRWGIAIGPTLTLTLTLNLTLVLILTLTLTLP